MSPKCAHATRELHRSDRRRRKARDRDARSHLRRLAIAEQMTLLLPEPTFAANARTLYRQRIARLAALEPSDLHLLILAA